MTETITPAADDANRAPEWLPQAVGELNRFDGPNAEKKRATVLALVDARLAGRAEETVWRLDETCSRTVYHTKWKKDATFSNVLETVTKLARDWKNGESTRALAEATKRLALAAPSAARAAILLLRSTDESIRLRAALAILDRAGVETAAKSSSETVTTEMGLEEWRAQQAQRQAQAAEALAAFAAHDPDNEQ